MALVKIVIARQLDSYIGLIALKVDRGQECVHELVQMLALFFPQLVGHALVQDADVRRAAVREVRLDVGHREESVQELAAPQGRLCQ